MPSNCVGVTAIDDGANVESGTDCGLAAGSDRQNADAALAALSDHGGETDVRPLGDTSAAIDLVPAGGCPATDQADRSRPKGPACDAGAFEADALPPPPPPPPSGPHAHTLVGDVDYEPAFGPGKEEAFYHLSPFVIHPAPRLQVVLLAADGATVMEQSLDPRSAEPDNGFGTYRFDALPACGSCTLLLRDGSGVVQDARAVSFDAAEGQTEQNLILSDRPGAAAFGAVMTPDRQARPGTLSVRLSRGGQVLADTGALPAQCPLINGGDWCGGSERFAYRLTGLPADNQPMTATLYERPVKYDPLGAHPQGPPVPVDSALVTAKVGPDRVLKIPDLTAPEGFPPTVRGRGLYGTVWNRPPYAPGDQGPGQSLPKGRHPQVVLFDGSRRIASAQIVNPDRNEPGRYSLYGLPPCANCKLKLIDGPMVADHARVTIPASPSISLIRRDLQLRDASGHFIGGAVRAPDSIRPDRLRIVVRRPGDPAVIADSEQLPHACRPGTDASHCHRGQPTYRLGGIPANTPVLVTLSLKTGGTWNPVDSRFLVTAARDQDTNVPGLELLPGVGAHDPGVQVYGYIVPGGPFAPGADAAPIAARASYSVSVLDAGGHLLGHTTATSGAHAMSDLRYQIIGLKSCDQCTVELRGHGGVLEDRAPLSLPAESPSVTRAPNLDTGHAAGGPYLTGSLSARTAFSHSDVVVRVLDANGEVRVSSTDANVSQRCGIPPGPCARSRDASFRLGHMPLDGQVTVGVMDTHTRRVLASARVTLAGNGADTFMPALRLANR
jgi:hypothetical protein